MAMLSDLIIGHPEVESFAELERLVAHAGNPVSCSWNMMSNLTIATHLKNGSGD